MNYAHACNAHYAEESLGASRLTTLIIIMQWFLIIVWDCMWVLILLGCLLS